MSAMIHPTELQTLATTAYAAVTALEGAAYAAWLFSSREAQGQASLAYLALLEARTARQAVMAMIEGLAS